MSILIKGMEMPHNCEECGLTSHRPEGLGLCHILHKQCNYDTRPKDCPLVEVPEPHGRLIDADRLINELAKAIPYAIVSPTDETYVEGLSRAKIETEDAPTVIEAEEHEHD